MDLLDFGITAVIPVRKGSQRVPGKNLIDFAHGNDGNQKNLLTWKIEQLLSVLPAEQILVSSDWDIAIDIAQSYRCKTHVRVSYLASAVAPFSEVIKNVISAVSTKHVMWTPATSPFVGGETIRRFINTYASIDPSKQQEGLVAVSKQSSYAFFQGHPLNFSIGKNHVPTQDLPKLEIFDWAMSARTLNSAITSEYMFSNTPEFFELTMLENQDINDELDFRMAQHLVPLFVSLDQQDLV